MSAEFESMPPVNDNLNVLILGAGHAGQRLHSNAILNNPEVFPNTTITLYDQDPARRDISRFDVAETMSAAQHSGQLVVADELEKTPKPDVIIVATNSGTHLKAYMDAYAVHGMTKAVGFEKVMIGLDEVDAFNAAAKAGMLDVDTIRVNETRALSYAVGRAADIIDEKRAAGMRLVGVDSVQYKLRLARFFDHEYGAQGIEGTHGFSAFVGMTGLSLMKSEILHNVNLNPFSETGKEATYTILRSRQNGEVVTSRFAQGLGNFTIDASGHLEFMPDTEDGKPGNPGMKRTIEATFDTGDKVKITFDPHGRKDVPKFSSIVEHTAEDGTTAEEAIPDDTAARFVHGLAVKATTGKDILPKAASARYALEHVRFLRGIFLGSTEIDDPKQTISQI
jgi:predicted dehydrogenase